MGFLTRIVKYRAVAVLIYCLTGVRARFGDSNGVRIPPIMDEAIPHVLDELRGFVTLIPLHDPVTLPVLLLVRIYVCFYILLLCIAINNKTYLESWFLSIKKKKERILVPQL